MLKLTNTLSGKLENFAPQDKNEVKMYVCGITPYDSPHVGHGRCYISFDLLFRILKFLKYNVTYCRNITDIDDKLLNKSKELFGDKSKYKDVANKYIKIFNENIKSLNCLDPNFQPRVTETIPEIIKFIENLIKAEKAYVADGDVYFSVKSFADYGKLSKHKPEDLKAGSRVEVGDKKRDPLDFALWKSEPEGSFWQSPWGWGRPGWHIECSAMALKYLGQQVDIHGGGRDLIFPHHENEIAQTEALTGGPFARFWVHNGFIRLKDEKMSKSLGNFFTLDEIFQKYDPMLVRFYFLSHQYRAPVDFSWEELDTLKKSYSRLVRTFESVRSTSKNIVDLKDNPIINRMCEFLFDDLNSPGALGILFENLDNLSKDNEQLENTYIFIRDVMGLILEPLQEDAVEITPEIQKLIDERKQARLEKDWAKADTIRDKLLQMGVDIKDKKL